VLPWKPRLCVNHNALCPGYVDTPLVRNQLEDLQKTEMCRLIVVLKGHLASGATAPLTPLSMKFRLLFVPHQSIGKGVTGQAIVY